MGLEEALKTTYGSIANFKKRTLSHDNPDKDELLSNLLGLKHSVILRDESKIFLLDDEELILKDVDIRKISLSNFIVDNIHLIGDVRDFYDKHGLGGGFYQLTHEDFL